MNTTSDAWVDAVAQSALWHSVADVDTTVQERARRVVRACAEVWAEVEVAVGGDPWWDSQLPLRILRWLAEARPRGLDSKTAFRLLTAPFVAEAIRAEATRILLTEGDADAFHSTVRGRARRIIESAQRRYSAHVRQASGAPLDWQRVVSRWVLHQAVRGDESTWTGRPGNLVRDRLDDFEPLVRGAIELAPFVGCDESRLLSASGPNPVGASESAGLLARAGALALDLRQVDEAALDGELATVTEIRALVCRDAWRLSPPTAELQGDCWSYPDFVDSYVSVFAASLAYSASNSAGDKKLLAECCRFEL